MLFQARFDAASAEVATLEAEVPPENQARELAERKRVLQDQIRRNKDKVVDLQVCRCYRV